MTKKFIRESNWFVVFARTSEESSLAKRLQRRLDAGKYVVFVPTKDYAFRSKGEISKQRVVCFPGYVFVAADATVDECFDAVKPLISYDEAAYRFLNYGDDHTDIAVSFEDKEFLVQLLNEEFNAEALEAVQEGHTVRITDGVLDGFEGRVKKIDKYHSTVDVEFNIGGKIMTQTLMLDIVEKTE
jgi:transcriptional antiterminator NusG